MKNLKLFSLVALLAGSLVSCSDTIRESEEETIPSVATLTNPAGFESEIFTIIANDYSVDVEICPYFNPDNTFVFDVYAINAHSSVSAVEEEEERPSDSSVQIEGRYQYDATTGILTLIHDNYYYEEKPEPEPMVNSKAFTVKEEAAEEEVEKEVKFPFNLTENANGELVLKGNIAKYIKWIGHVDESESYQAPNSIVLKKRVEIKEF